MQWSAVLLESDASLAQSSRQQAADSTRLVAGPALERWSVFRVS